MAEIDSRMDDDGSITFFGETPNEWIGADFGYYVTDVTTRA